MRMLLVTGATGFVGQALCAELARRGIAFRGVARSARDGYTAVGGIDGATDWSAALDGVDTIIHLAARVHVMDRDGGKDAARFHSVNTEGTLNLARQAAAKGVRRLVFISTIKVNGEATDGRGPFKPGDPPDPQDAYAASKLAAEVGLRAVGGETGLETVIVRPPLVYGPGVKANFESLMKLVRRGVPLPFASVRNARSLVYVGNLVDLAISAAAHPNAAGRTFLAADGEDLSTPDLIRAIATAQGRPARLFAVPPALLRAGAGLVGRRGLASRLLGTLRVDIADTRTALEWSPPFTVAEGLRATVAGT